MLIHGIVVPRSARLVPDRKLLEKGLSGSATPIKKHLGRAESSILHPLT